MYHRFGIKELEIVFIQLEKDFKHSENVAKLFENVANYGGAFIQD